MSDRVIVVGGGAAGLMAAGQAALAGADVVLLEKMKTPGRKVRISGKGRCNVTNVASLEEFITHFGKNGRFLRQPFHRFFSADLMDFFESCGLPLVKERGGRVFPASSRAGDVVEMFSTWLEDLDVSVRPDSRVEKLLVKDSAVQGVVCSGNNVYGKAVIVATGGLSYPATGSTGDGYTLAKAVGHTIETPRPALVPVETAGDMACQLAGLHLRNIAVSLFIDNKKKGSDFGELLFMKYGLSGPVILTLSSIMVDALSWGKKVELHLDLKPALDLQKLDARLLRDFASRCKEPMDSVLRGLMAKEMVSVCLAETGISATRLAGEVQAAERKRLRLWLKDIVFSVTGYRGFKEAIVTAGGVALGEINPRTMESKCCSGLYLAGELLDLQADTGGYNLQAAFSTGWLAGRSAAEYFISLTE
jgi:predicted Rossmann fold flavoprotein